MKSDLTEASLLETIEALAKTPGSYRIVPTKFIVPPWVLKEIEEQYGVPATAAKYHQWNMKRLNLTDSEYMDVLGLKDLL
jgi:hypothetical protein